MTLQQSEKLQGQLWPDPEPANSNFPTHPSITLEPWQYRITSTPHPGATRCGDVWLSHAADLPVVEVVDAKGGTFGALIGFPIDLDRREIPDQKWTVPDDVDLTTESGVHAALGKLGGRFLWICQTPRLNRIYPDAATQISCVWDHDAKAAGATAMAILDDAAYAARFDHSMFATLGHGSISWLTAGLTAHSGVHRLLPNHYLDLNTWTAHRWNTARFETTTLAPNDVVDSMIASISQQIEALLNGVRKPLLALTGGLDSRTILACARDNVADLKCVTIAPENMGHRDTRVARDIAETLQLKHEILPNVNADRTAQEVYLRRSGHSCADSNMHHHASVAKLNAGHAFIGGIGADIAQAPYWYDDDTLNSHISPKVLLARLGLPQHEKTLRYLSWWRDALADHPNDRILDLAYLELRLGPWAMAQYCAAPGLVRYAPFLTYDNVKMMQALPPEWKQGRALGRAIVGRLWPELLRFPINARLAPPAAPFSAKTRAGLEHSSQ